MKNGCVQKNGVGNMTTKKTYSQLTKLDKEYLYNSIKDQIPARELAKEFDTSVSAINYWRRLIVAAVEGKERTSKMLYQLERKSRRDIVPFILNRNPPTELTKRLIINYYADDVQRGLTHEEAITDISLELGRTKEYILEVLKGMKGK